MDYEISCAGGTPANKRRNIRALLQKFGAENESSALMTAIEENDEETVEQLLVSGVDLGACDRAGNTALHIAARLGYGHLCSLLVRHGADVNVQNQACFSPLFFAARVNVQTVSILLHLGADMQLCNHVGEIPLHAASSSGLVDVIMTLVSCGSDVNARSLQGVTPLYCAIGSGSRQAVKTLVRFGADVNGVVSQEAFSSTAFSVNPSEKELDRPREKVAGSDQPKNRQDVRVRLPRQTQFYFCGQHRSAEHLSFRSKCSDSPEVCGRRPAHDQAGSPSGRRHPSEFSSPGCQQKAQPLDSSQQPHQVCPATHCHHHEHVQQQHMHRIDPPSPTPCLPSGGHRVFKKETGHHVEESLSDNSRISPHAPATLQCSCEEFPHLQSLVLSSPVRNVSATCRFLPQCSACPLQMCGSQTPTLHGCGKIVSCCSTSDDHCGTKQSTGPSVSVSLPQLQKTDVSTNQASVGIGSWSPLHQTETAEKLSTKPHVFHGLTPLHQASKLGMETVAEVLLEAGANVNARTERGETPLHMAAMYSSTTGHGEVTGLLRLLLGAGADVEAVTSPGGSTPLHCAAVVGDALCTSLLLLAKADLHKQDSQGNTPLHKACERIVSPEANRLRTVRLLLMNGASAQVLNNEGLTPLHVLLSHKTDNIDHDVVRILLNCHADPNLAAPSGELPLLMALRSHMYGFAKVLVEKGADPNIKADDGKTPLHYVCKEGQTQLFRSIWSKGGNPATPDNAGFTPLRYAMETGDEAVVQTCLSSGVATWQPPPDLTAFPLSVRDMFGRAASCVSPFQYAFATAQLSFLVLLHRSGCFSSSELHRLREVCEVSSLQELTGPQRQVVSFVLGVSQAPASLQEQSGWTISRFIGCGADRNRRARELGLPAVLRDFVLLLEGS